MVHLNHFLKSILLGKSALKKE